MMKIMKELVNLFIVMKVVYMVLIVIIVKICYFFIVTIDHENMLQEKQIVIRSSYYLL